MKNINKLTFFNMLKEFGLLKLFNCFEFFSSLFIPTALFYLMFYIYNFNLKQITLDIAKVFLGVDATILGFVISGLAILLSVSDRNFLKFLYDKNLYTRFFFPFYLSSVLWGTHIVFCVTLIFFGNTFVESEFVSLLNIGMLYINIFWFLYSLLNSVSLVGTIIRLGHKKIEFDDAKTAALKD